MKLNSSWLPSEMEFSVLEGLWNYLIYKKLSDISDIFKYIERSILNEPFQTSENIQDNTGLAKMQKGERFNDYLR